jgi:hypothetical protein
MNTNRFVSVGATVIVSALQWALFCSSTPHTQPLPAAAAAIEEDTSGSSMPVIVVTAHRQS